MVKDWNSRYRYASKMQKLALARDNKKFRMKSNPAKKKPRTAAQKAATARMLAANKHAPKHIRTAAQKRARKAANTVPGYYPNPGAKTRILTAAQYRAALTGQKTKPLLLNPYKVFLWDGANKRTIAAFAEKTAAMEYAQAHFKKYNVKITVET